MQTSAVITEDNMEVPSKELPLSSNENSGYIYPKEFKSVFP